MTASRRIAILCIAAIRPSYLALLAAERATRAIHRQPALAANTHAPIVAHVVRITSIASGKEIRTARLNNTDANSKRHAATQQGDSNFLFVHMCISVDCKQFQRSAVYSIPSGMCELSNILFAFARGLF